MAIPIEYDRRYRVNKEIVKKMRKMRQDGCTCAQIARKFDVCQFTVVYWTNDKYRKKKRGQNAKKRTHGEERKEQIRRQVKKRRELSHLKPVRMLMRLNSAENEYRSKRHTIMGKTVEEYRKEFNKKYKTGGNKIGI